MIRIFAAVLCLISYEAEIYALTYTPRDSLRVVELLRDGARQPSGTNLMLYYGHRLEGIPYVGKTLEVNPTEQLVINLYQLDCTTFVETVVALTLTTKQGSEQWSDYCHWLQTIRYRGGQMKGYPSRNHYFSQWIESNQGLRIVSERQQPSTRKKFPFTGAQTIDVHYMTSHPDLYPMLKDHESDIEQIRQYEEEITGRVVHYIPSSLLNKDKATLHYIQDGDILALVTSKDGLDISHVGLAEWGKDGYLHLLNASSNYKKVILDPEPLYVYMKKYNHRLGVRSIALDGSSAAK